MWFPHYQIIDNPNVNQSLITQDNLIKVMLNPNHPFFKRAIMRCKIMNPLDAHRIWALGTSTKRFDVFCPSDREKTFQKTLRNKIEVA